MDALGRYGVSPFQQTADDIVADAEITAGGRVPMGGAPVATLLGAVVGKSCGPAAA
jgi:hypothetical protein